ncbi:MAG: 3-hydroxyacyl-CoA dehydrogenase [Desulfobacterales bacterium]|nr:3-hydroxyacyl-CoA dehydrogenase [Desulfobacterales bacterium]
MKAEEIQKVLIIGAGTMGQQIGWICAVHGLSVVLYDIHTDFIGIAAAGVEKLSARFVRNGHLTGEAATATRDRMAFLTDPDAAAAGADLVSESVPEDPELKGRVLGDFNRRCPAHTIFTTNTSTLLPSQFAEATGRPDRFAALHFHDVSISRVVDVMPHPGTSDETTATIRAFALRIGQDPVMLQKENSGYVFNTMLTAVIGEALTLAANGVASVADIDRSWMGITHMPTGPFGIMDSIGLTTVWKVSDYWAGKTKDPKARANADFVQQFIDQGRLGRKTGQGFYTYAKGEKPVPWDGPR